MTPTAYAAVQDGQIWSLNQFQHTASAVAKSIEGAQVEPLYRGAEELYAALAEVHKDLLIFRVSACKEAQSRVGWVEIARNVTAAVERTQEVLAKFGERS